MRAIDLIEMLQEVDGSTPIYFFNGEGGMEDDQRTPVKEDDIDLTIEGQVDINVPEINFRHID